MDLINTPMSRVTCPNVENPENRASRFWAFRVKMLKIDRPGSPDCEDMKKFMWEGYFPGTLFWGFWGRG
jgi:hypothetical protein